MSTSGQQPTNVHLILTVIDDEGARGAELPKALRVTLENDAKSGDRVRVEKGLTSRDLIDSGVLVLNLRTAAGPLKFGCFVNAGAGEGNRYLDLGPGESITRVLKLGCYHPPSGERITATATYMDRVAEPGVAQGEADTADGGDPSRGEVGASSDVFRGPLPSNTVEFTVHAK